jgi:hypothetical protein
MTPLVTAVSGLGDPPLACAGPRLHGHMAHAAAAGQLDLGLTRETDNSPRALTRQLADLFGTAAIGSRTTRDKTAGNIVGPQFLSRSIRKDRLL